MVSFYMNFLLDLLLFLYHRPRQSPTGLPHPQALTDLVRTASNLSNAAIGLPIGKVPHADLSLYVGTVHQGQALVSNALPSLLIS